MFKSLSTSLILRGILAVAVGIMALAWPQVTVLALVILFAVYAFIAAGLEAMRAFSSPGAGPVFGHLLLGLVDLAAGVVALAWPGPTALVLVLIVGTWAVIAGVVEIAAAFAAGEPAGTRALFILGGLVSIAFGAVLFARPGVGAITLALLFGLYNLVYGARTLVQGIELRRTGNDHPLRLHGKGEDGGLIRWHDRRRLTETAMRAARAGQGDAPTRRAPPPRKIRVPTIQRSPGEPASHPHGIRLRLAACRSAAPAGVVRQSEVGRRQGRARRARRAGARARGRGRHPGPGAGPGRAGP